MQIKLTPVYIEGWVNFNPFIAFEMTPPPKDMDEAKKLAHLLNVVINASSGIITKEAV